MTFKTWFACKTVNLRAFGILRLMKVVTPTLYHRYACMRAPRPVVTFAKDHFNGKPVTGAEIGVFEGTHAKLILQTLNVETLFLVDPYVPYDDLQLSNIPDALPTAIRTLEPFKDRIQWVKKTSEDALQSFEDESLDFVYVDGNHKYGFVKRDLQGYWSKVRSGGILGGHDLSGDFIGVCRAVVEFSRMMNKPVCSKGNEYWFIKGD